LAVHLGEGICIDGTTVNLPLDVRQARSQGEEQVFGMNRLGPAVGSAGLSFLPIVDGQVPVHAVEWALQPWLRLTARRLEVTANGHGWPTGPLPAPSRP
jgi:hypothetical protein